VLSDPDTSGAIDSTILDTKGTSVQTSTETSTTTTSEGSALSSQTASTRNSGAKSIKAVVQRYVTARMEVFDTLYAAF
jgi:hypothetical protein